MKKPKLYRHGDVLIQEVKEIPPNAEKKKGTVLVEGEITGHAHQLVDPATFQILTTENEMYVDINAETQIVHEEHDAITLPKGKYKVWVQQEYTPQAARNVMD